ncbi:hypothetical protein KUA55_17580 [Enterococcus sp. ALS3]|uniref:Uncharacterized protein n=1 Tax=Enterococcus alishanensis TaxID=1303817 RepID=A0ABS6TI66_9ENTE|nr:hypothetical protein [Enterococcus alishanensis]MBV7392469.1 hypothetical protein [Enterococcus alishanensis]
MEKFIVEYTGEIITMIISLVVAIITSRITTKEEYKKLKAEFRNKEEVRQDEQTQWVNRLTDVTETITNDFGEKEILIVLRCIRAYTGGSYGIEEDPLIINQFNKHARKKVTAIHNIFLVNSANESERKLTSEQCEIIRITARILLKIHWENMEEKVKGKSYLKNINKTDSKNGLEEIIKAYEELVQVGVGGTKKRKLDVFNDQ